jgi:hypothetical protein
VGEEWRKLGPRWFADILYRRLLHRQAIVKSEEHGVSGSRGIIGHGDRDAARQHNIHVRRSGGSLPSLTRLTLSVALPVAHPGPAPTPAHQGVASFGSRTR